MVHINEGPHQMKENAKKQMKLDGINTTNFESCSDWVKQLPASLLQEGEGEILRWQMLCTAKRSLKKEINHSCTVFTKNCRGQKTAGFPFDKEEKCTCNNCCCKHTQYTESQSGYESVPSPCRNVAKLLLGIFSTNSIGINLVQNKRNL